MDMNPRANAAQMAARTIKAKPKGRLNRPNQTSQFALANSVPQFAPMPSQESNNFGMSSGGSNMFGGGITAPSSFNFASSHSGPSLSFPSPGMPPKRGFDDQPVFHNVDSERVEDTRNPKRQFNGPTESGQQTPVFETPNLFGQQPNKPTSTFGSAAPMSNGFTFGKSSPSVSQSFPPTTTPNQSNNNPFNFSASPAPAPSTTFGFTSSTVQPPTQAPLSPFQNFGNSTNAKPSNTGFSFGQTATSTPATNFGRAPTTSAPATSGFDTMPTPATTASSSGFVFGATAATSAPSNNLFGSTVTSQPPAQMNNSLSAFGSSPSPKIPTQPQTPTLFGHLNQPASSSTKPFGTQEQSSAKPAVNFFATQAQTPAVAAPSSFAATPTSNIFGGQQSTPAPTTSSLFGGLQSTPAMPSANVFDAKQPTPSSTTIMFGNSGQTPAKSENNLFNKPASSAQATNNAFDGEEQSSTKVGLFGNQGQATNNLFGQKEQTPAKSASTPFGLFGQTPAKPSNKDNVFSTTPQAPPRPNPFPNLNASTAPPVASTNVPEAANAPSTTRDLFSSTPAKATTSSKLFGSVSSPATSSSEPLSTLNQPLNQPKLQASSTSTNGDGNKGSLTDATPSQAPPSSALTQTLAKSSYSALVPHTPAVKSRLREVQIAESSIDKDDDAPEEPASPERFLQSLGENQSTNIDGDPSKYPEQFPGMEYASRYPIEKMDAMIEENYTTGQRLEFYTGYRMLALNKAMQRYFKNIAITDNIFPAMNYYNSLREVILQRTAPDLKRKASDLPDTQQSNKRLKSSSPIKQTAEPAAPKAIESSKPSASSQLFLNGNTPSLAPPQSSPFKAAPSLPPPQPSPPKATSSMVPRQPSPPKFTPAAPSQGSAPDPPLSKGKRRGEDLTKDAYNASEASSPLKRAKLQPTTGSNTSNLFKSALNSPARPLAAQGQGNLEKAAAMEEKPKVNPFAKLPGTSSPSKSGPPPSFPSAGSTLTASESSLAKAAALPSFSFGANPTTPQGSPAKALFGAPSSATPATKSSAIKPPTFTAPPVFAASGGNNFLSQFGAKAKDWEAENEKKLMERAQDEDYDSDDDLEEWQANYKKKRAAELKELEDAKVKNSGFVFKPTSTPASASSDKPTGGFVFKPTSQATSLDAPANTLSKASPFPPVAEPKPLFGQSATAKSSGASIFESLHSSRAPTPTFSFGAAPPDTVAAPPVFDGMFGHLSKQNSEAGSDKENSDEEDNGAESDSENKDPNYDPKVDSQPGTPGTPAEETGAGIASTKKPASNPFAFGGSTSTPAAKTGGLFGSSDNSGTSTPRPSLFDRITRDSSGQPVKDTSEEKENTQPAPTNLFGSLNKPVGSPSDQTWKTNSPIKFGSTTPATEAKATAPAVTVQAATPTKPSAPLGNLFGTSKPSLTNGASTSMPGLFAGLNSGKSAPSTGVGFGFGAASGSSSLFPSTAASANTSRATTPGATTDGDSATESNDPDAEKQEQIDLSAQAPGEEQETKLYEVRAKASKYDEGIKGWQVKGTGLLRVLRHNDTKEARILIRTDLGKIVLNKSLLSNFTYLASQKTVKLMTTSDDGKGLETWILQVKTIQSSEALAEILEANKKAD